MAKKKKQVQLVIHGKYPGNVEIGEFYNGNKRAGLAIIISDVITKHSRSQIHHAFIEYIENEEEG